MEGESTEQGALEMSKPETTKEIHDRIDAWFASDEFKAIRKWGIQIDEMMEKVGELTKECKNEYDVILYYNDEKTRFGGSCHFCCSISNGCKKGKRKEIYIDKDGIEHLMSD